MRRDDGVGGARIDAGQRPARPAGPPRGARRHAVGRQPAGRRHAAARRGSRVRRRRRRHATARRRSRRARRCSRCVVARVARRLRRRRRSCASPTSWSRRGQPPGAGHRRRGPTAARVRIAVVTHGQASSPFWAIVRNGVEAAARQMDVVVTYRAPDVYSVDAHEAAHRPGRREQARRARRVDPEAGAGGRAIRRAVRAGHPGRLDQLGQRRLPRASASSPTSASPRSRAGSGRPAPGRRRRAARAVRQPPGRQPGPRRALPRPRPRDARRPAARRACSASTTRARRRRAQIADAIRSGRIDGVLALNATSGIEAVEARAPGQGIPAPKLGDVRPRPRGPAGGARAGQLRSPSTSRPTCRATCRSCCSTQRARYGLFPAQGDVIPTGPNFVTRDNAAQAIELSRRSIR